MDDDAERTVMSQRLERFEERAEAWKSLKAQHLARIQKLERELSAAKAAASSALGLHVGVVARARLVVAALRLS